ncbi:RluA family pseudouridine synthase [Paenibacillus timonensis]|uniref:RNA pseudouridylate synthase n=1 Tax=Paenibacillus timonensis TaxID=225915 RepID=A0ABW3SF29_9BACL|nr:RluA family pseudouridine synthase [Paenibacillus timonensis]MCH1641628.1 RluA family pseudouridine synthase [Paenibacillus timonensis]GJM79256.1 pseudouridine synthase [Paenibacillus sp. HMSSN-139]
MSGKFTWTRRGEWLELMPGKLPMREGQDRLDAAAAWLEEGLQAPPKLLRRLRAEGGVKLAGDRLRLLAFPARASQYAPLEAELPLLYEDDFCLVVHKPAGLKVHPDGSEGSASRVTSAPPDTLANRVAGWFAGRGEPIAAAHIHRLDEFTSGPVLFAKNEYAHLKLDEAMSRKEIGRTYIAFVQGIVSPRLKVIDQPIGRDRHHNQRRRASPGGKPAVTHVELLEVFPKHDVSLVRLTLETGRTHQIRVHLSAEGHPLVGDALYGGSTKWLSHQALHGERLSFPHPLSGEAVEVDDPWPPALTRLRDLFS